MTLFLLWVALSAAVGYLGRYTAVGFWGFFVFSLVFTPLVGALSLFVAGSHVPRRSQQAKPSESVTYREVEHLRNTVSALQEQVRQQALKLEELRLIAPRIETVPMAASSEPVLPRTPVGSTAS